MKARDLLCYWGTRELGMTTVGLAKKLNLSQLTISQSAMRGQKAAAEAGKVIEINQTINQWMFPIPRPIV